MKKIGGLLLTAAIAASAVIGFAGCNSTTTLVKEPNTGIAQGVSEKVDAYDSLAYYSMEEKKDVKIALNTDSVQKVSLMYRVLDGGDWSLKNGVLTVKGEVFEGLSAGDKNLRVFVDNSYLQITVRIVSKVIYTVEDFMNIRYNMNGSYTLANDLDFSGVAFQPIGKAYEKNKEGGYDTGIFEGIFDGGGHSIKNVTINARDWGEGEDNNGQGPSLGGAVGNSQNYSNGIFMQTSGNAQIINTTFENINVICQGISGAVVGMNGGLIKNCFVTCTLDSAGGAEHAAGIAGVNGSGDAPGRIENCLVVYKSAGSTARGIADWNNGTISNCYAAVVDDYVFHPGYDSSTGKIDPDFDINTFWDGKGIEGNLFYGNWTVVAAPGSCDTSVWKFYPAGKDHIINSDVVRKEFMLDPHNFTLENGWDRTIWNFREGAFPKLIVK